MVNTILKSIKPNNTPKSTISLKQNLSSINELVAPVIKQLLSQDVESGNAEAVLYQCEIGGKRIRPALVVLSGQVFGCQIGDLLYPAASIEILHNSTLIIDDIIDHSLLRRDEPTCWNKFGKSFAECMSPTYMAAVFAGLSHVKNGTRLIDLYSKTIKVVIDGEIKDILFERSGREDEAYVVENRYKVISMADYLGMIGQKTAALLQACCMAGAICAEASEDQVEIIGDFGFNLGMAFQIRDDILDIFGDEKEFGKKIGKDIIEKKMGNFIILSAIEQLDSDDQCTIFGLLTGTSEISETDIATITALIKKTDAESLAQSTASAYVEKAFVSLGKLPRNEYTARLKEIANYIIFRKE